MRSFIEAKITMENFIHEPLGALHTFASILALVFGAIVLKNRKGNKLHKRLGYVYIANMLVLNVSAIGITNMSGSVGMFHLFILISLPTTLAAIYFPVFSRSNPNWRIRHFEFMYWSYVGLIAAFIAEVIVRVPVLFLYSQEEVKQASASQASFIFAAAITGVVMFVAEIYFRRYRKQLFG